MSLAASVIAPKNGLLFKGGQQALVCDVLDSRPFDSICDKATFKPGSENSYKLIGDGFSGLPLLWFDICFGALYFATRVFYWKQGIKEG